MERVGDESFWLCCPGFADELVGCETFEGLQATAGIVSIDEVIGVALELGVTVVVIALDASLIVRFILST